jgi:hypothetical protein
MNSVTFLSKSKAKLDLLIKVAKEMGIETSTEVALTDEDMVTHGTTVNKKALENWLAQEDGELYSSEEMKSILKEDMVKYRSKNN